MLAALAIIGAGSGWGGGAVEIAPGYTPPRPRYRVGGLMTYATHRASGTNTAQQKRASKKARNVSRHKKHVRG